MEYMILITMFLPNIVNPPTLDGLIVDKHYDKPLVFYTKRDCNNHIKENRYDLEEYAMYYYMSESDLEVKDIICIDKSSLE